MTGDGAWGRAGTQGMIPPRSTLRTRRTATGREVVRIMGNKKSSGRRQRMRRRAGACGGRRDVSAPYAEAPQHDIRRGPMRGAKRAAKKPDLTEQVPPPPAPGAPPFVTPAAAEKREHGFRETNPIRHNMQSAQKLDISMDRPGRRPVRRARGVVVVLSTRGRRDVSAPNAAAPQHDIRRGPMRSAKRAAKKPDLTEQVPPPPAPGAPPFVTPAAAEKREHGFRETNPIRHNMQSAQKLDISMDRPGRRPVRRARGVVVVPRRTAAAIPSAAKQTQFRPGPAAGGHVRPGRPDGARTPAFVAPPAAA